MFKKILCATVLSLILPIAVLAADIKTGDSVYINQVQKNSYLFGSTVNVNSETKGDLTAFGNDVFVDQSTERSLFAGGATVKISAPVGQSLRAFGATVTSGEAIGEDEIVFAGSFTSTENNRVGGDMIVGGSTISLNSEVAGKTRIYASNVTISGKYASDVEIRAEKISINPNTTIDGKLTYYSENDAAISSEAKIKEIDHKKEKSGFASRTESAGTRFVGALFSVIGLIILTLIANAFLPGLTRRSLESVHNHSGRSALYGLAYTLFAPVAIFAFLISVIGIIFGIAAIPVYVASLFLASTIAVNFIGKVLTGLFKKDADGLGWLNVTIGSLAFVFLSYIPILGWFIKFALIIVSLGGILIATFHKDKSAAQRVIERSDDKSNGKSRTKK